VLLWIAGYPLTTLLPADEFYGNMMGILDTSFQLWLTGNDSASGRCGGWVPVRRVEQIGVGGYSYSYSGLHDRRVAVFHGDDRPYYQDRRLDLENCLLVYALPD